MWVRTLAVGAIAATTVFAGAAHAVGGRIEPRHDRTVVTPISAAFHSVVLRGDEGSVTIKRGARSSLTAHESWDFTEPSRTVSISKGVLSITTDCKREMTIAGVVGLDGFNNCTQDLTLTVPESMDLDVASSYGAINVSGISGKLLIEASDGAVVVNDVRKGSVKARSHYGSVSSERLTVQSVSLLGDDGDVTASTITSPAVDLHSKYGTVTAHRIRTTTLLATDDSGDVNVDAVAGTIITATSLYGTVAVHDVSGTAMTFDNQSGDVTLSRLRAEVVHAHSKYGAVSLSELRTASLVAIGDSGDVSVVFLRAPDTAVLHSAYGNVALDVPTGAYAVTAQSSAGPASISRITVDPHSAHLLDARADNGQVRITGH